MGEQTREVKRSICFFCHDRCGVLVHLEGGKPVKIEGDRKHLSHGHMCIKGRTALEHLDHPDRLNYAMKRTGERGENKWQRITWEQALDEIADRLQKIKNEFGAESLVTAEGTLRTNVEWVKFAFTNLFGTPNTFGPGTICWCNTQSVHYSIYGWFTHFGSSVRPGTTKCIVEWGHNPSESSPIEFVAIRRAQREGAKLIVIDPRRTPAAKESDVWLSIRPGTDGALALAWLNVIINEKLYDKEFVEKWTFGFDKLRARVQQYPPGRVAQITGIPEEKIVESARMYSTNRPGVIVWGLTLDQIGRNSSPVLHAQCCLRAITGNLDVPGGEYMGWTGDIDKILHKGDMDCTDRLPREQRIKQLGADRFKLQAWPGWELLAEQYKKCYGHGLPAYPLTFASPMYVFDAIQTGKPYPVKAMIVQADNTLLMAPNTKKVYRALKALSLLVVMDYWITPTAMLADYALPAAAWLERSDLEDYGGGAVGNVLAVSEQVVPPLYDRHTDYEFWRGLALRLGLDDGFPWSLTLEELIDYRLKPAGLTMRDIQSMPIFVAPREFRKYEKQGFATPSGKVELYSSIFEKLGYDPLPNYEEPPESPISTPEVAKEYPLILSTSPRHLEAYHSEHRQIQSLRRLHPDPQVEINEDKAKELGINAGDWVYIETLRGRIRMKARPTRDIPENVVMTEHSWWFPEEPAEEPFLHGVWISNPNLLTIDNLDASDQMCGGWALRGLLCKVYKVKSYV